MSQTTVVVRDPVTYGEDWDKFTDYEVRVESTDIAFSKTSSTVRRRYSEFAWLFSHLEERVKAYPGLQVPGLPPKKIFGRFEADFIEARRKGLEQFLQEVLDRPQFLALHAVHLFLQSRLSAAEIDRFLNDGSPIMSPGGPDCTLSPTILHYEIEPSASSSFRPTNFTSSAPSNAVRPTAERVETNGSPVGIGASY